MPKKIRQWVSVRECEWDLSKHCKAFFRAGIQVQTQFTQPAVHSGHRWAHSYPWRYRLFQTSALFPGTQAGLKDWLGSQWTCVVPSVPKHGSVLTLDQIPGLGPYLWWDALERWRRKWQPTPVFLPGESQGRGRLVGCRLWGHTELDTTEVT